jgi:hypothetical protein
MATTGTYTFDPSLGELMLYAYNLCQIRGASLTQEHMQNARVAANLICSRWSNQGVNLWAVDLVTQPLTTGIATYAVDPTTVMILDAYVVSNQSGENTDRIITPVSRSEYASYPNKTQQGFPTVFWFDRLLAPTITLWQVPNTSEQGITDLKYYRVRRLQDANLSNGASVEIPYLWLEAFALKLGHMLSLSWKPEISGNLQALAQDAYDIAAEQNTENVPMYISPMMGSYWRP